jgi:hypothetical protein
MEEILSRSSEISKVSKKNIKKKILIVEEETVQEIDEPNIYADFGEIISEIDANNIVINTEIPSTKSTENKENNNFMIKYLNIRAKLVSEYFALFSGDYFLKYLKEIDHYHRIKYPNKNHKQPFNNQGFTFSKKNIIMCYNKEDNIIRIEDCIGKYVNINLTVKPYANHNVGINIIVKYIQL